MDLFETRAKLVSKLTAHGQDDRGSLPVIREIFISSPELRLI
jgi:hypothetical protein